MKNIAIIPARSGSKGIKDKNIKQLCGKPLMAYSIEAAIKSQLFDEIFVSTDSEEYAGIAQKYGASVPFLRSMEIATDSSSSWMAVREAIYHYREVDKTFDTVTLLQPTSPLRRLEDICGGYQFLLEKNANAVVSVCETELSPMHSNQLNEERSLKDFIPKQYSNIPRQKLPVYYRVNGALYIVRTEFIMHSDNLYQSGCYAYIMDEMNSIDIDTELDFAIAETIMSFSNKN